MSTTLKDLATLSTSLGKSVCREPQVNRTAKTPEDILADCAHQLCGMHESEVLPLIKVHSKGDKHVGLFLSLADPDVYTAAALDVVYAAAKRMRAAGFEVEVAHEHNA